MKPRPADVHVVLVAPLYRPATGPAAAAGMRAWGLATGLHRLGFPVSVVTAVKRGTEPAHDDGIEIVAPRWPDFEKLAASTGFTTESNARSSSDGRPARRGFFRSLVSSFVPDRYASWIPSAAAAARRTARPGAVLVTTGPPSSRYVGRTAHGKLPWIADVNDLWAFNPWDRRRPIRDRLDQLTERATVGAATRMTTVNDRMAAELRRRYPVPVDAITSGYEPRDFDGRAHRPDPGRPVTLLFAGTVYPSLDMRPLWSALRTGLDGGWLTPDRLRVAFVGPLSSRMGHEADDLGLSTLVEARAPVPRDRLLDELVSADVLLLPLYERDPYALPMRFFEYVGAGRPILGLGSADRVAGELILQHGLGLVAEGAAQIEEVLRRLVDDREAIPAGSEEARALFTWDRSVERFADIVLETSAAVGR